MKTKHTWLYRLSKIIVLLAILAGIYAGVSYILVCNHLHPITPIATPYLGTPAGSWGPTAFSFIHQTNERQRMLTKSKRYHGFEIDLYTQPNDPTLYVAHDPRQFKYKMTLQAAFSIPKEPAETSRGKEACHGNGGWTRSENGRRSPAAGGETFLPEAEHPVSSEAGDPTLSGAGLCAAH